MFGGKKKYSGYFTDLEFTAYNLRKLNFTHVVWNANFLLKKKSSFTYIQITIFLLYIFFH